MPQSLFAGKWFYNHGMHQKITLLLSYMSRSSFHVDMEGLSVCKQSCQQCISVVCTFSRQGRSLKRKKTKYYPGVFGTFLRNCLFLHGMQFHQNIFFYYYFS